MKEPGAAADRRWQDVAAHVEAEYRRAKALPGWDPVFTAEGEGMDPRLALAACLLHDIAYFSSPEEENRDDHGRTGARLARPTLRDAKYANAECDAICRAIAAHADGNSDDGLPPSRLDGVVSDADNVHRWPPNSGAVRERTSSYGHRAAVPRRSPGA